MKIPYEIKVVISYILVIAIIVLVVHLGYGAHVAVTKAEASISTDYKVKSGISAYKTITVTTACLEKQTFIITTYRDTVDVEQVFTRVNGQSVPVRCN